MGTLSTLHSRAPLKLSSPNSLNRRINHHHVRSSPLSSTSSLPTRAKLLNKTQNFLGTLKTGFPVKLSGYVVKAAQKNEGGLVSNNGKIEEEVEDEVRGQSSMPERFRYLSKEAPDKPLVWPWFVVLGFMIYAWRTVLWELSNWKRAVGAILQFFVYISKFILALIFRFIGDPVTSLIQAVETTFYTIRAFYSGVINYAPIPELTLIIMLTSAVLAMAEATVPDSVNSQPYLLTIAGLIGFAAVRNYITELFFWTLLIGLFGYARLVKKRDYVSSALPLAAVLAAVGEPWVRVIVIASYVGLATFQRSSSPSDLKEDENSGTIKKVPVPLICAALAIGVRVAAKWAGYRHLTWMVV